MAKPETLAALKLKFPKVNLSKKRLDAIADKIEAKVTDDNTLDAAIDTFNDYNPIEDIAKSDDKLRTAEEKLKLAKNPPKTEEPATEEPVIDDSMPAWAKAMMEQNKKLTESFTALQTEKIQGSIRQTAAEKLKEIPVSYWGKRAIPQKEEDLEAFVTEVQTDYQAFEKELTDSGIKLMPKPVSGGAPAPAGGSKAVSADVKNFMGAQKDIQKVVANPTAPGQGGKFINTPAPL